LIGVCSLLLLLLLLLFLRGLLVVVAAAAAVFFSSYDSAYGSAYHERYLLITRNVVSRQSLSDQLPTTTLVVWKLCCV
jgi:hypothetical protein